MKIAFTKMHGAGNDYLFLDGMHTQPKDPAYLARLLSPRHTAVGADGLVVICPSDCADARMRMFNRDGSEGEMCGNAIRCVGKYLYEHHFVHTAALTVETNSGIKRLTLHFAGETVRSVAVEMGKAVFTPKALPTTLSAPDFSDAAQPGVWLSCGTQPIRVTPVSVGNPHAVVYADAPAEMDLAVLGREIETHPAFPGRVNAEFVRVISPTRLTMRVWERGSGETYACGTGACAVTAASVAYGYCPFETPVTVEMPGGDVTVTVRRDFGLTLCGEAVTVYEGVCEVPAEGEEEVV